MRPLLLRFLVLLMLSAIAAVAVLVYSVERFPPTVAARDGQIDVSHRDFAAQEALMLGGQWRWQPRHFATAADPGTGAATIDVPRPWNQQAGAAALWGSYALTVQCLRTTGLALLVPAQHSASRWLVNGSTLHQQGLPADSAAQERAQLGTRLVPLSSASCPLHIVAHVSNFEHAQGGMVHAPLLGEESVLALQRGRHLAIDFALMGCLGLLGVLALAFYGVRRRESSGLWFALFCGCAAVYTGLANERLLERLGLQLSMQAHLRLEYAAWHLATPLLLLFLRALFPQELGIRPTRWLLAAGALPLAIVLLLPMPVVTASMAGLQLLTLASIGWLLARLTLAVEQRRPGAAVFLAGLLTHVALLLPDSLQFAERFEWQRAPFGLLAFVLAAAAAMLQRLARALTAEEQRALEQRHRGNLLEHASRAAEHDLAFERDRLRLLVRSTKAGFGDWDAVTDVVTYTDRFKEMLGYPADHDTTQWPSIFEMMHPDDRERAREQFRQMIRRKPSGGEQEPGEPMSYRLLRRDGSPVWIHAEGISQVDDSGRTLRFITSYLDVTRFREQEEALRAQIELTRTEQRRLDLVVRGARVGIVDWDGRTHETYYSPRLREIRGCAPDADTRDWPDYFKVLIHPDDRERVTRRWVAFIRGQGPEGPHGEYYAPEEYRLLRADGSHVWVQVSGMAVRDARGFVLRWIAAIIDITERRRQDEAREDMERIGRHDLKTPLNTIIAVPRLLRERGAFSADDEELLGIVERAGLRILSLVNLSLDLFRMEQGSYAFRPQPIDLLEVLRSVLADVRAHAETKRLQLVVRIDGVAAREADAVHAWAEDLLCYSILANLTKNAIEAAPEASAISIDLHRSDPLRLTLHNRGAVPAAVRESFFDKYSTAGKSDGTGLGTYSAWLMARIQGGALVMRSSEADGTTLELTLKKASARQAQALQQRRAGELRPAEVPAEPLPARRVLAVDDDEFNLLVMRRYLPNPPLAVFTAVNGRAAIEQALQCRPDLVLIDLDMPVLNGLDATRRLRELQREGALPPCPIVMLSSHDDDATRRRALDAGCDHYLCKPVSKELLLQTVLWAAGRSPQPPLAGAPDTDAAAVVIDPDLVDRMPAFLESRRALLAELEAAAGAGDADAARRLAHRLAGSFALYGLHWAAGQCRALERGTGSAAALQAALAALRAHLDGVQSRTQPAATTTQPPS
ncbi:PAS domain-containing protein [Aquincola sp. S2]|uniref:histidine kinase n=1 Tax=Pseudaquabacterium terrae TaxID=2732868 RepID=A0ABX2EFH3_9BURK|nr:PAS domain-containing protein [Aquabacterium terrae]NRF67341.1 PAS domain-containing protein [Aquabacterium terrae]